VLAALHLTRQFDARTAVRDVTFEIAAGEIVALLGPNGAGKTTTLRMLAGLIEPTAGEVHLDGVRIDRGDAGRLRPHVGFLTEAPGLWDHLTVAENLRIYARLHGLTPPAAAVDRALETFGLAERRGDTTAVLSKGLKQRVALARALLHDPKIVLLDEPTSGLDPESARAVRDLVVRLRDDNRAVLISTHNLDEVQRMATRVAVLRQRLLAVDTPEALRAQLFGTRVRIALDCPADDFLAVVRQQGWQDVSALQRVLSVRTHDAGRDTPPLVRALVEAGAGITSVVTEEPSLEDVYLRLVHQAEVPA
jgi:ABC-2 type transport system ATP-binding protein